MSVFSLLGGLVFGTFAVLLLVTDGRFSSYDVHWAVIGLVAAGLVGTALVAAAVRAILAERDRAGSPTDE